VVSSLSKSDVESCPLNLPSPNINEAPGYPFPSPHSQFNIEMIDYDPLLKELKFWKQQPTLQPLIIDIYLDLSRLSPSLVSYLYSSSPGELTNSLPRYLLLEKWTLEVS
jgi:hypothetical protein